MRAFVIALVLAAGPAEAGLEFVEFLEVEWESSSTEETELAHEISELYLTLYNTGNLPIREIPLGDFDTPLEAFANTGGYFSSRVLPGTLDGLLCDLNPQHCSRARQSVDQDSLETLNFHVGGFAATRTRWTVGPKDTIIVPFVEFEQTTRLDRLPQPNGWTSDTYVAVDGIDCSQWKTTCEDLVKRFNPHVIPSTDGRVEATVPVPGLVTTLRLRADDMAEVAKDLGDGFETLAPDAQVRSYADPVPQASVEWQKEFNSRSQLDMAIEGLSEGLSVMGTVKDFSSFNSDPLYEKQSGLFKLINHPFAQGRDLSEVHKEPVGIVIIDEKVELRHCDWPNVVFPDGSDMPADKTVALVVTAETNGVVADALPDCAEIFDAALSGADHAAHVAGIIMAQPNGKGMVGLNPYARISFVHYDRKLAANRQLTDLKVKMINDIPDGTRVANMSGGLDRRVGSSAKIRKLFNDYKGFVLFVAAAGNDGLRMDGVEYDCDQYPACLYDLDNVVTVVGINRDTENPAAWNQGGKASNTNPEFGIAAVAENVFSTVTANRYGHKSGTSQAAPQVTAAASLIFSAGDTIFSRANPLTPTTPKIVKDRLRYSADLVPKLMGDVWGGRLNVDRAIDVANARFELFDDRVVIGQIESAPEDYQCTTASEAERKRSFWATRRIVWNELSQKHVIFHNTIIDTAHRGNRFAPLERFDSCTLATRTAKIIVRVRDDAEDEGEAVTIQFSEIRDYTSRLFD